MNIYVDFDDCICETAKALSDLAGKLFNKGVPYEDILYFNLQDSFKLTDDEYVRLMTDAHLSEALLSFEETPGASSVLNEWMDEGHEVYIITGRPANTYEASRKWLDKHNLDRAGLFFLNKYGRDFYLKNSEYNLELEDYYKIEFDCAIEDSPLAFSFFRHLPELKVMVFDRPWNREEELPGSNYSRCPDWEQIRERVRHASSLTGPGTFGYT